MRTYYWRLRSKCLWFRCAEDFSSRYLLIFGLRVFGTTSGILQEEADYFKPNCFHFHGNLSILDLGYTHQILHEGAWIRDVTS